MNENNMNEEKAGGIDPVNSDYAAGISEPSHKSASYADDMTEDGFSASPELKPAQPVLRPAEYKREQPFGQTPPQPQQPLQPNIPPQSPYRPVQNNQPQPTAAPYNPYTQNSGYNPYQTPYNNQPQTTPPQPANGSGGKNLAIILIAVCVIVAVLAVCVGIFGGGERTALPQVNESTTVEQSHTKPTINTSPETTISDSMNVSTTAPSGDVPNSVFVAQKVRPSVVGIMTYSDGELTGEGSGVLMSEKDGWTYIITCAHVIDDENVDYGVLLLDGTNLEAHLVAYDSRTDIGVIKVNKTGLPLAEFGDSTTLQVGEPIYAIGNPGGSEYFGSITDGIVASIDRSVTSTYTMTCIQHNAAINPGNSGGALVNTSGQIIGINSSKIASTEFEGMGFAVPTSIAGPVVDSLINYGYVPNRPKLGIECAPVNTYQLYSIIVSVKDLPQGSLVITAIESDSNLIGTTVEKGDLIIAVNGEDMTDSSVLLDRIDSGNVGDILTLTIARINSRTYKVTTFDVQIALVEDKGSN